MKHCILIHMLTFGTHTEGLNLSENEGGLTKLIFSDCSIGYLLQAS